MVEVMSDNARQQKLASAKKKLKKFQKGRSPVNGHLSSNDELGKEILRGIQNNHIFKTPPLTVAAKQVDTPSLRDIQTNQQQTNKKLNFPNIDKGCSDPVNTLSSLIGTPQSISESEKSRSNVDLEQNIASYKRANEQLGSQVQEQRKQILQLQERLKKDAGSASQLVEQKALKEQLEVHIQTIGILVSEKSELQSNVANIQKRLANKEKELVDINNNLQKTRQHVVDIEKQLVAQKAFTEQLQQVNKDLVVDRDRFSSKLYETSHEKDEVQLQNSELYAKLHVKVEECATLLNQVNQLHVKLQQSELMIQQLSANAVNPQAVASWHSEKEELVKLIDEQKNIVQKLVSDKAELLEKHNDTESHYDIQIEQLKNKINMLEDERHALLEKSNKLSENLMEVQKQLETVNVSENDQPNQVEESQNPLMVSVSELENANSEKQSLEKELDIQINENRRLGRTIFEQNARIEELESQVSRLTNESTGRASLLDQIQADKETISRALQQNKVLKEQLEELEEGFVKMSNSSADLTSKLESEQHGNKDIAGKLSSMQVELEETKYQLKGRNSLCQNLTEELQTYKDKARNVQKDLASKDMDLELLTTELETVKHELSLSTNGKQVPKRNPPDLSLKLQEELQSAQDTINQLSLQNTQLKETIAEIQNSTTENPDGSLYPGHKMSMKHFSQSPTPDTLRDSRSDVPTTEEEQHARSWEEIEDDDEYGGNEDESDFMENVDALRITNEQVDQMQQSLHELQTEREKILYLLQDEREKAFQAAERIEEHVELKVHQQLLQRERELQEHFYEQTEVLHSKVQSLQEALEIMRKNEDIADFDMTSDGITMPLLKTAFMQLQKHYKSAMDAKAQLSDRIDQLEHTNMKLETETETIGEYIALYQTQRAALKTKFGEKDRVITQLSNEHGRMQTKVTQLHQLVMQLLSERSGIESKNKQLQELVNRRLAIQNGDSSESEVPKLQYNLDNLFGQMTLTPEEENELIKDNITVDESIRKNSVNSDVTTQQILQIFEQLETTGEGYLHGWLSPAARKHDFQPCKNCIGSPIYL